MSTTSDYGLVYRNFEEPEMHETSSRTPYQCFSCLDVHSLQLI